MTKNVLFKMLLVCMLPAFISVLNTLYGQQSNQDPWFTSEKIAENVWRISDHGADNMYLISGTQTAMLIDNGTGMANIRDYIKKLTGLPVIVVITHGHPDH